MTKVYRDIEALLRAIHAGHVPVRAISPSDAAAQLGISRQAVFKAIAAGHLDCWRVADGSVILVSVDSVNRKAHATGEARKVG